MKELNIRAEEPEAELDKLLTQHHGTDEELKSRVAMLETLSFIDSLTQLIQQAEGF